MEHASELNTSVDDLAAAQASSGPSLEPHEVQKRPKRSSASMKKTNALKGTKPKPKRSSTSKERRERSLRFHALKPGTRVRIVKNDALPPGQNLTAKMPQLEGELAIVETAPVYPQAWLNIRLLNADLDLDDTEVLFKVRVSQLRVLEDESDNNCVQSKSSPESQISPEPADDPLTTQPAASTIEEHSPKVETPEPQLQTSCSSSSLSSAVQLPVRLHLLSPNPKRHSAFTPVKKERVIISPVKKEPAIILSSLLSSSECPADDVPPPELQQFEKTPCDSNQPAIPDAPIPYPSPYIQPFLSPSWNNSFSLAQLNPYYASLMMGSFPGGSWPPIPINARPIPSLGSTTFTPNAVMNMYFNPLMYSFPPNALPQPPRGIGWPNGNALPIVSFPSKSNSFCPTPVLIEAGSTVMTQSDHSEQSHAEAATPTKQRKHSLSRPELDGPANLKRKMVSLPDSQPVAKIQKLVDTTALDHNGPPLTSISPDTFCPQNEPPLLVDESSSNNRSSLVHFARALLRFSGPADAPQNKDGAPLLIVSRPTVSSSWDSVSGSNHSQTVVHVVNEPLLLVNSSHADLLTPPQQPLTLKSTSSGSKESHTALPLVNSRLISEKITTSS